MDTQRQCKYSEMYRLNLPRYDIKMRGEGDRAEIYDILRRKYVALAPEEWVRQHFVHYLVEGKHYPAGLMANEVELRAGEKRVRCDTVVYDNRLRPLMIVEYKAPDVSITRKVFDQIAAYNSILRAGHLTVSNGMEHVCCRMDYRGGDAMFLDHMPDYGELTEMNDTQSL